jgi:Papain family cysteine protease
LYKFSEQYLVSCDFDDSGCDGGLPSNALDYIGSYGTVLNSDYPYTSGSTGLDGTCQSAGKTFKYPLTSSAETYVYWSYTGFKAALRQQVVDVGFDVQDSFMFY